MRVVNVDGTAADCGSLFGHEDWVVCISHYISSVTGAIAMVYGSQDCQIRVWHIRPSAAGSGRQSAAQRNIDDNNDEDDDNDDVDESDKAAAAAAVVIDNEEEKSSEARFHFEVCSSSETYSFGVFLDAICVGHEDWVTSCNLVPSGSDGENLRIVSTSMDRNIIIWAQDDVSGVWLPITRMGDIGGTLGGSVGGNLLGFVWCSLSPCKRAILSIGYGGSFHLWSHESFRTGTEDVDILRGRWEPLPFLTGHFNSVADVVWGGCGDYIVSVSKDQTCRVFCPVSGFWREGKLICIYFHPCLK
jgi:elongator complex protein 2